MCNFRTQPDCIHLMDINGQWQGTLTYGKEYRQFKGHQLSFEMELHADGEQFYGTAIDTGGMGTSPDTATIQGRLIANQISLIKQYPRFHYVSYGQGKIDSKRKGPLIHYEGEFKEFEQFFEGQWVMRIRAWLFGLIPYTYACTGTWRMMRKQEDAPPPAHIPPNPLSSPF